MRQQEREVVGAEVDALLHRAQHGARVTSFLTLSLGHRQPLAQAFTVFASSDVEVAREALAPLIGVGPVLRQQMQLVPFYLSFDTDTRPERLHDAFPGATLDRLRALKAVYDPNNVFDRNFPIPPALDRAA